MADPKVTTRLEFIIEEQQVLSQVRTIGNAIGKEIGKAISAAAGDDKTLVNSLKEAASEFKGLAKGASDVTKLRKELDEATKSSEQYASALRNAQIAQQKAFAGQARARENEEAARAARDAARAEKELADALRSTADSTKSSLDLRQRSLKAAESLAKAEAELATMQQRSAAANQQVAAAAERVAMQQSKMAQSVGEAVVAQDTYLKAVAQHNAVLSENIEINQRTAEAIGKYKEEAKEAAGVAGAVGDALKRVSSAEAAAAKDAEKAAVAMERLSKALRAAELAEGKATGDVSRAAAYEAEARAALEATKAEVTLAKALEQGAKSAREAAEARLRVAQLTQTLIGNEANVEQATLKTVAARHQLAQAEERSAAVRAEMAKVSGGSAAAEAELVSAIERTNASMAERISVSERAGAALGTYRQRAAEAATATKGAASDLSSMGQIASSVVGQVMSLASAFTAYYGIVGVMDAIVTTIRAASVAGREYESAFIGVAKTTDGVLDSMNRLTALGAVLQSEFSGLSREIPLSITELLKLGELGGQFDIPVREIAEFSSTVGRLVSSTDLQSETAAESLAQLRNVLALSSEELDRFASALVYAGNNSATTESSILALSRRLAGTAATYDIHSSSLIGIASALKSVGVETEAGSTQIQKFFNTVNTAVLTGNEHLLKIAETAGLTVEEFSQLFEEDSAEAFVLFVEGLGRAGREAVTILSDIGLKNERAVRTFLPLANAEGLLREQVEGANEAFRENTALMQESELRYETAAAKIQLMKNAWTEFLEAMSNAPLAGEIAEGIGEAFQGAVDFLNLNEVQGRVAKMLDELSGTFGEFQLKAISQEGGIFGELGLESVEKQLLAAQAAELLLGSGMQLTTDEVLQQSVALAQLHDNFADIERSVYAANLASSFFNSGLVESQELADKLANAIADGTVKIGQLPSGLQRVVEMVDQGKLVTEALSEAFLGASGSVEVLASSTSALTEEELALLGITEAVAEATGELTEEQLGQEAALSALAPAYADAVQEMLKGVDASHEWVAAFIEQAAQAGATKEQMEQVLIATGALSEEQLAAAANTALFAAEQARLFALVQAGSMSYGQAAAALAVYAAELGLAASQAAAFGEAQAAAIGSSFVGGLESSMSGGGGGGGGGGRDGVPSVLSLLKELRKEAQGAAKDIEKAAKDAKRELTEAEKATVEAAKAMKELDNELLNAAESAGATNREILDLAVALGELTPEEATAALAQLARGEGIKAIAKAYVEGRISADEAKTAVEQLNAQIAQGANIDLSDFGIQIRDVSDLASKGASGAGGAAKKAADEFRNWRLELLKTAESGGAPLSTLVKLARATGEFSEETILSNARIAALSGTVSVLGEALATMPVDQATDMLDQFDRAIKNIGDADKLAEAIDVITSGAGGIDSLQEQLDFMRTVASGLSVPVSIELVQTGAGHELSELITDFAGGSEIELEVAARIVLDIVDALGVNNPDLIAYVTRTAEELVATNDGITIETAVKLLLNLDESEARRVAGQYSEKEIQAFFPSEAEVEMGITVRAKISAVEGGDQGSIDNALELAILGKKQFGERAGEVLVGVDGDAAELLKSIEEVTEGADDYTAPVAGEVEQLVTDIQSVTEDAEYETQVRADTASLASDIQDALDSGDFTVKVDVEVDASEVSSAVEGATAPTSRSRQSDNAGGGNGGSRRTSAGGGSSSSGGGGVPRFAEGGMVNGPSHAQGGVLAELEGGEYVIPKDRISPEVRTILDDIRGDTYSPGLMGNKVKLQPQQGAGGSSGSSGGGRTSIGSSSTSPGLVGNDVPLQPQAIISFPDVSALVDAASSRPVAPVPPSQDNSTTITNNYDMSRHTTTVNLFAHRRGSVMPVREIGAYT